MCFEGLKLGYDLATSLEAFCARITMMISLDVRKIQIERLSAESAIDTVDHTPAYKGRFGGNNFVSGQENVVSE